MKIADLKSIKVVNGWCHWSQRTDREWVLRDTGDYMIAQMWSVLSKSNEWRLDVWPVYGSVACGDPWQHGNDTTPRPHAVRTAEEVNAYVLKALIQAGTVDLLWYVIQEPA